MGRNDEPNDLFPVCVAVSADISQNIDIDYIPRGCCERCFQYVRCSFHFYCVGASISLQRQIIIACWKLGMEWVGFGGFSKKGMWGLSKQGAETALANPSSLCNLRPCA